MKELFQNHLNHVVEQAHEVMDQHDLDDLFIESGLPPYYFKDDQPAPFKPNPYFLYFCPDQGQGHLLRISRTADRPTLFFYSPTDFWHETSQVTDQFWVDCFDIQVFSDHGSLLKDLQFNTNRGSLISPNPDSPLASKVKAASDQLYSHLNWIRTSKTEYEIRCITEANKIASRGHKKAKELFLNGETELSIFNQYIQEIDSRESELPYNSIVAFDKNSAVLHYQSPKNIPPQSTFLIDAGARFNGYCSDITRTYVNPSAPELFKNLLSEMELRQKKICQQVTVGTEYVELHRKAYQGVAELLVDLGLASGSKESLIELEIPSAFYPHGLGHPIGIQVHDVGGKQSSPDGSLVPQPKDFPFLRTLRKIQPNDVVTIEPGFYFIPSLLEALKKVPEKKALLKWDTIELLVPCGGIRIEDNVVARVDGLENLTRQFLN